MKKIVIGAFLTIVLIVAIHYALQQPSLVIGFAGDTMLGRTVSDFLMQLPTSERYTYPWGTLLPLLLNNDLNILNLETTLTTSTKKVPKVFNFKADPDLVNVLKTAHIDVVNIANNHILDFSDEGFSQTIATLDAASILHVGAGSSIGQAARPVIISKKNIRIGIIGYTDNEPDWAATDNKPGTNYIKVGDIEKIKTDIRSLRNNVDILILSIHWGPNKIERPTKEFKDFAHQIIDAGVDIIHGHSPHLLQGIEIYNKKLIMYGTGDFIDDYAVYPDARNDFSCLFNVTINKQGPVSVQLIPTIISTMQVNRAMGAVKAHILKHMQQLCRELGTSMTDQGIISFGS